MQSYDRFSSSGSFLTVSLRQIPVKTQVLRLWRDSLSCALATGSRRGGGLAIYVTVLPINV
jgi:hypothetical protein